MKMDLNIPLFDDNIVGDDGEPLVDVGIQVVEEKKTLEMEAEAAVDEGAAVAENLLLERMSTKYYFYYSKKGPHRSRMRPH